MARETEFISFKADMSDLRTELAKLPGMTDKEARAMVRSLERQMKKAEKAAQKAAKKTKTSFDQMGRAANKTGRDLRRFGQAAGELSPALGGAFNAAGSFTRLLGAMANPVTLAIAGVVGLGAAAVGAGVAMVKITRASDELLETLEPFDHIDGLVPELDQATIDSIHRANRAMDALWTVVQSFTLTLGGEFAPYVEHGADLLLRLALMGQDAFSSFAAGKDVVREFAVFLATEFVQSLTYPIHGLFNLIGMLGDLASAVGLDGIGDALSGIQDRWEGFTRGVAEAAVDTAFGAAAAGVQYLDDATAEYAGTAEQLIGTMGSLATATGEVRDVNGELSELIAGYQAERMTAEEQILAQYREELALIAELEAAGAAAHDAELARTLAASAAYDELSALRAAALEETTAEIGATFAELDAVLEQKFADLTGYVGAVRDAALTTTDQTLGAIRDITDTIGDQIADGSSKAAKRMHAVSVSAGVAQATISTLVGIMKAMEMGLPVGPIVAAGVAVQGAATVARIIATPAPQAHMGQIAPSTGLQPDEVTTAGGVRALRSETILDSATSARLGEAGARSLMDGAGSGRPVVVPAPWKHLDGELEEVLLRDSRTSRALAGNGRIGRRS